MPPTPKRRAGRPPKWWTHITAPATAIQFYEMVSMLQNSDAFRTCHVYDGMQEELTGIPLFKFETRVHAMPKVICSYLGIAYGRKICSTPGCVNPFHHTGETTPEPEPVPQHKDDWDDLVLYYVEETGVPLEYAPLRAAIPEEDISEPNLCIAIENLKRKKAEEN